MNPFSPSQGDIIDQRQGKMVPQTLGWNQLSHALPQTSAPATPDLRTQLQPFQDLQPDEIQDQLQKLHIQHPDAGGGAGNLVVVPQQQPPQHQHQQQQQQQQQQVVGGGEYETVSSVMGGDRAGFMHQFSSESSSGSSSRRSSTNNNGGLIAQLLCPSPPAQPISPPQTEGLASHVVTTSLPPNIGGAPGSRRSSLQDPTGIPKPRPQRCVMQKY